MGIQLTTRSIVKERFAVVAKVIIFTIHRTAFVKRCEVVPAKGGAVFCVVRVPTHAQCGEIFPTLGLSDGKTNAQDQS